MYTTNRQIKSKSYSVNQEKQQSSINLQEKQKDVKTSDHEGAVQSNGNGTSNADTNQDQQQASQHNEDIANVQETPKISDCKYAKFRVSIVLT